MALTRVDFLSEDRAICAPEVGTGFSRHMQLIRTLNRAVATQDFTLHYQPQVDISTGKLIGAEALLRCYDDRGRSISPTELIPIAETIGSIHEIGIWAMRTACKQNVAWQAARDDHFPIAVNLSAKQLQHPDLFTSMVQIFDETQISPEYLELEITENTKITELDTVVKLLSSLRELGVRISLDDFGTGYSSLALLKQLPLDALKIDRTFIKDLTPNSTDAEIVRMIVSLSRQLNLTSIAEGVETQPQLDCLRSLCCDAVQGYLFSPPVSAEEFICWLQQHNSLQGFAEAGQ
jgi:EAL domain-containing protein (putative c-di-GMP-specific phosphodiesterase class I)